MSGDHFTSCLAFETRKLILRRLPWIVLTAVTLAVVVTGWLERSQADIASYELFARICGHTLPLTSFLVMIIAALSVNEEVASGSLRAVFLHPVHRSELILSKLILQAAFALFCGIAAMVSAWIVCEIEGDFGPVTLAIEGFEDREIFSAQAMRLISWKLCLAMLPPLVAASAFGVLISTLIESEGMAVAVAVFLYLSMQALAPIMEGARDYLFPAYLESACSLLSELAGQIQERQGAVESMGLWSKAYWVPTFIGLGFATTGKPRLRQQRHHMLKVLLGFFVLLVLTLPLSAQRLEIVEFGAPFEDWFVFDFDDDGHREILVFFAPEKDQRPFAMASYKSGTWKIEKSSIPRDIVCLALGSWGLGKGRQLAMLSPTGVTFLYRNAAGRFATASQEIKFQNLIRSPLTNPPGFWHWPIDVDGDGHDDLYLPGDEGILVHYGDGKGGFTPVNLLPFRGDRSIDGNSTGTLDFERSYPHPIFVDLNSDHRPDLCWFDDQGLAYVLQKDKRAFALDSVQRFNLSWLSTKDTGDVLEQTEIDLEDLNGDGCPDLFLSKMSTPSTGVTNMNTTLVVLLNDGQGGFKRSPDFALKVQGLIGNGPHFGDWDGDGHLDIVFGSYGSKISDAIQRMMGKVTVTYHVHRGTGQAQRPFSGKPDYLQTKDMTKKDYQRWGARKNVIINEDFDGDGIGDLFLMKPKGRGHEISVHHGQKDSKGKLVYAEEVLFKHREENIANITIRTISGTKGIAALLIKKTAFVVLAVAQD